MIDYPDLELRDEDRLAAAAIARVSGGLTADVINAQIRERQEILKLIADGLDAPICPELTNANPSAPHTVLLEAQAWQVAQLAYRFNRVPEQNFVAFANLFGVEPRVATAAETTLRFTVAAPTGTSVTIPANTQVSDESGEYVFETTAELTVLSGTTTGSAAARRTIVGYTMLSPNVLTAMIDSIAFVTGVTNLSAVDSGTELEPLESTLNRVKRLQRRGTRIVSVKDLEEAILDEALNGNGIVRAFPFVQNGDFNTRKPGYTTVIAMTKTGNQIDDQALLKIGALLDQVVGNQFVYIVDPVFISFRIEATVRLTTNSAQGAILTAIENNLRNFYAPAREQFGRSVYRSEIIALIESVAEVDRIEATGANIVASPTADLRLFNYQLPKLADVIITIV